MRRVLFACAAGALVSAATWACGPFFPNSYLVYGGKDVLRMPATMFSSECFRILGIAEQVKALASERHEQPSASALWQRTTDVDLAEFAEAVRDQPQALTLTADYTTVRMALSTHIAAWLKTVEQERYQLAEKRTPKPPFDFGPYEKSVAKLPPEFAEYLRAADAYHNGDYDSAIAHFAAVLDLPANQRKFRSTWAAFMLGKCWSKKDPAQAAHFFEQTRTLVAEGFRDPLKLAADSLGWQARAELASRAYVAAIHHYAECAKDARNATMAYLSLAVVCDHALNEQSVDPALVKDPLCREVITAWLVSHPSARAAATKWLAALAATEPQGAVPGADRLAWLAYQAADMPTAARWLDHAVPDAPYGQWVRAKLLLREGNLVEGAALLQQVAALVPTGPDWEVEDRDPYGGWLGDMVAVRDLVREDLGYVLLEKGDYPGSLDAFLASGDWSDAACVAERVLTVDELETFVQAHAQDPALAGLHDTGRYFGNRVPPLVELRNLLARRLARLGEWEKAIPYYPERPGAEHPGNESLSPAAMAREVAAHLAGAQDAAQPVRTRAEHLFEVARILRQHGMKLTGTELSPDWALVEGYFDLSQWRKGFDKLGEKAEFGPEFASRFQASATTPPHRFHYRYQAADLMWQCGELLPNNDVLAAHALYLGGLYLEKRDRKSADKFYKALVRRNPNLLIAQQADKLRWFPKEFTDGVVYQPLPRHWYGSRRKLAVGCLVAAVAVAVATTVLRRRRRTPNSSES